MWSGSWLTVRLDFVCRDLSSDWLSDILRRERITQAAVSSTLSLTADTMACKKIKSLTLIKLDYTLEYFVLKVLVELVVV